MAMTSLPTVADFLERVKGDEKYYTALLDLTREKVDDIGEFCFWDAALTLTGEMDSKWTPELLTYCQTLRGQWPFWSLNPVYCLALGQCAKGHWSKVSLKASDYQSKYVEIVEKFIDSDRPEVWDLVLAAGIEPVHRHHLYFYAAREDKHYVLASFADKGWCPTNPWDDVYTHLLLGNHSALVRSLRLTKKNTFDVYTVVYNVHLMWKKKVSQSTRQRMLDTLVVGLGISRSSSLARAWSSSRSESLNESVCRALQRWL